MSKKFGNLIWVLNGGIFLACTYRKIASFSTLTKHFWPSLLRNNQWFFLEMQSDSKIYDAFLVDKFSRACAYHRIACVITSWENWPLKTKKRKNGINSKSAFCIQSAVCILYWPDWYCCFCSSEPQVRTEILELGKKISEPVLAVMIDM